MMKTKKNNKTKKKGRLEQERTTPWGINLVEAKYITGLPTYDFKIWIMGLLRVPSKLQADKPNVT